MSRDYKKIVAWQRAHELTLEVYRSSGGFPPEEKFALTSQLRRAAYSVPANVAEWSGRGTKKEYMRFLHVALASLKETECFLLLSRDLGYLGDTAYKTLTRSVDNTFAPLDGFIKTVRKEV